MKSKVYMMLAICASFVGFTHTHLEATSEIPPLLVVSVVRNGINAITLSTNTVGTALDADITDTTGGPGAPDQLIGFVEWNATKQSTVSNGLQITQLERQPTGTILPVTNAWPLFLETCGNQVVGDAAERWTSMNIYSCVDPASTNLYLYSAAETNQVDNIGGTGLLTTATELTYCGLIGILSFYAVDDPNMSLDTGTYRANLFISITGT